MKDVTKQDIANAAKRLSENDDFNLIMECVREDICDTFLGIGVNELDNLQKVHTLSHGFQLLNTRISKYITDQAIADSRDEDLEDF